MNRILYRATLAAALTTGFAGSGAYAADAPSVESDSRTTSGCFENKNPWGCALRADNDPQTFSASQPASFAYTANSNAKDSYAVQAALKLQYALNDTVFPNVKALWHKNNQQKKEQDNLALGAGLHWEFLFDSFDPLNPDANEDEYLSLFLDTDVAVNRKAVFPDLSSATCQATPFMRACMKQTLDTLRLSAIASPFIPAFHAWDREDNEPYWIFSPVFGLYFDTAMNDKVVQLSGATANGDVIAGSAGASLTFSPSIHQNKWEFKATGLLVEALTRSSGRVRDFQKSSALFTASISFALAGSYIGDKTANTWIPALSLTYTNGSDPIKAKAKQDALVLGLTVKY